MTTGFYQRHKDSFRTLFVAVAVVVAMVSGVALATLARADHPAGSTSTTNLSAATQ